MDDELTPEQQFAVEDAETMVPRALLVGKSPDAIVADLVCLNFSPQTARNLVARTAEDIRRFFESPESRQQLLGEARRQFVGGILLSLVGVGLTAFTFLVALAGGLPFFVIASGLVFGGAIVGNRGWRRWRYYQRLASLDARAVETKDGLKEM